MKQLFTFLIFFYAAISICNSMTYDEICMDKAGRPRTREELLRIMKQEYALYKNLSDPFEKERQLFKLKAVRLSHNHILKPLDIGTTLEYVDWLLAHATDEDSSVKSSVYNTLAILFKSSSKYRFRYYSNLAIRYANKQQLPDLLLAAGRQSFQNTNFEEALKLFQRALFYMEKDRYLSRSSCMNDISLCLFKLKRFPEQRFFLEMSLKEWNKIQSKGKFEIEFYYCVQKNLADYYFSIGNYEKTKWLYKDVITYFSKDISTSNDLAIALTEWYSLRIPRRKNDIDYNHMVLINKILPTVSPAVGKKLLLLKMTQLSKTGEDFSSIMQDYRKLENRHTTMLISEANNLNDVLMVYLNKVQRERNANRMQLEVRKTQAMRTFYLFISILLVLGAGFALYVAYSKLKRAKIKARYIEEKTKVSEYEHSLLEASMREKENEHKQIQINLMVKNEAEQAFLMELKKLKKSHKTSPEEVISNLQIKISQLLELDKRNFLGRQHKADKQMQLLSIRKKFPELTNLEQKLFLYFKLEMTTKEIANLLDMTEGSIRVYKNRIRKKIQVDVNTPFKQIEI